MSKEPKFSDIKLKTYDFIKPNEGMLIVNGVDIIAHLDLTNKEARYEIKQPKGVKFITHHKGRVKP